MATKEEIVKFQKEIEDYKNVHPYVLENEKECGCDFSPMTVSSLIIMFGGLVGLSIYSIFKDILIASVFFSFLAIIATLIFCKINIKKRDRNIGLDDTDTKKSKEVVLNNTQPSNPEPQQIKKLSISDYIKKIENKKNLIEDKVILNKLNEMLQKLSKIQKALNDFEDKEKQVKKVINYYLPSIVNVVDNYINLESRKLVSNDFNELKLEVIATIDTAIAAFNEILNQILQNEIFETLVETQTLNSVLKGELSMEMQR